MENGHLCAGHCELGELGFLCTDLGGKNSPAKVNCFFAVSRQCPANEKGHSEEWPKSLIILVGGARFELATNGLKVRCSTG